MLFGHDPSFWLATFGAIVIKIVTASNHSWWKNVFAVFAAVFAAYLFTDVTLHAFGLDVEKYKAPVAALLALTGESLMRWLHSAAQSPLAAMTDIMKAWRGGK